MAMSDIQRYPWRLFQNKYELDIYVLITSNCLFSLAGSMQKWLAHFFFFKAQWRNSQKWTLQDRESTISYTFSIRWRFQGYRCKSDIVIFELWVLWNYPYSPFMRAQSFLNKSVYSGWRVYVFTTRTRMREFVGYWLTGRIVGYCPGAGRVSSTNNKIIISLHMSC